MRSTLFASCLLGLSFAVVGCDDAKKADETTPPPVVAPTPDAAGKGAMEGSTAAPAEPGKGAMEGTGGAMEGSAAAPVAPTTPETKSDEMPK